MSPSLCHKSCLQDCCALFKNPCEPHTLKRYPWQRGGPGSYPVCAHSWLCCLDVNGPEWASDLLSYIRFGPYAWGLVSGVCRVLGDMRQVLQTIFDGGVVAAAATAAAAAVATAGRCRCLSRPLPPSQVCAWREPVGSLDMASCHTSAQETRQLQDEDTSWHLP